MTQALSAALLAVVTSLAEERQPGASEGLPVADFALERPMNRDHGDWASNAALKLTKNLGANPRELAVEIAERLDRTPGIASVEVAGPGLINIVWIPPLLGLPRRRSSRPALRSGRTTRGGDARSTSSS